MKKALYLSVNEPCHENWDRMLPAEKGKFCNSCNKQVVDFTQFSDTQLLGFFKSYEGALCGRYRQDQLNRPITWGMVFRSRIGQWVAGLLMLFSMQKAHAQDQAISVTRLTGPGTDPVFDQSADEQEFHFELVGGALAKDTGVKKIIVKGDNGSLDFFPDSENRFHLAVPNWWSDTTLDFEFYDSRDLLIGTYGITIKDAYKYAYARIEMIRMPEARIVVKRPEISGITIVMGGLPSTSTYVLPAQLARDNIPQSGQYPVQSNYNPQGKIPVHIPGKVMLGNGDMPGIGDPPAAPIDKH